MFLIKEGGRSAGKVILGGGKRFHLTGEGVCVAFAGQSESFFHRIEGENEGMNECLQKAMTHFSEGNFPEAEACCRQACAEGTADAQVFHLLGMLAMQRGEREAAVAHWEQAVAKAPAVAFFDCCLARACAHAGKSERALALLQHAVTLPEAGEEPWRLLGDGLLERERYAEAEDAYKRAFSLREDLASSHYNLGRVFMRTGRLSWALDAFASAIKRDASHVGARLLSAEIQAANRLFDDARRQLRFAETLEPENAEVFLAQGNLSVAEDRIEEALAHYERAWSLDGGLAEACAGIGYCRERQGETALAEGLYRKAFEMNPRSAKVWLRLGNLFLKQGKLAEAYAFLPRALAGDKSDDEAGRKLAEVLTSLGDLEKADFMRQRFALAPLHPPPPRVEDAFRWKLARQRLPGPEYLEHLRDLHAWLRPSRYLEIGFETGRALALAVESDLAVGVDPQPRIEHEFRAPTKLFPLTSDAFFAQHAMREVFDGAPVDFAFPDGLHVFRQVLRDFIHIERICRPTSVIVYQGALTVDDASATAERRTVFWTGDLWKLFPCLRKYRPEVRFVTVPTYPTGLTVVTGLDPTSTVLEEHFEAICREMSALTRREADFHEATYFNLCRNDKAALRAALEAAGVRPFRKTPDQDRQDKGLLCSGAGGWGLASGAEWWGSVEGLGQAVSLCLGV